MVAWGWGAWGSRREDYKGALLGLLGVYIMSELIKLYTLNMYSV